MELFSILMFCGFLTGSMGFVDIEIFFPSIEKNLTKVIWAHAVNNAQHLNETLFKNEIMMIEADVQLGTLSNSSEIVPIMAHPPNNVSDLSLEMFFKKVDEHNKQNSTDKTKKGIKLDFKQIDAFLKSRDIISSFSKQTNYPVWIDADILFGPISAAGKHPVNATQFLEGAKGLGNAWLSLGWTTYYGSNIIGEYNDQMINEMITLVKKHNITNRITFSVRAGLAGYSRSQMMKLLTKCKSSTLTIWSNEGDFVEVTLVRKLISSAGVDKIFIDVPDDLKSQLKLDEFPRPQPKPSCALKAFVNSLTILLSLLVIVI